MSVHDIAFLDYKAHILALSVLIIALKFYFNSLKSENSSHEHIA